MKQASASVSERCVYCRGQLQDQWKVVTVRVPSVQDVMKRSLINTFCECRRTSSGMSGACDVATVTRRLTRLALASSVTNSRTANETTSGRQTSLEPPVGLHCSTGETSRSNTVQLNMQALKYACIWNMPYACCRRRRVFLRYEANSVVPFIQRCTQESRRPRTGHSRPSTNPSRPRPRPKTWIRGLMQMSRSDWREQIDLQCLIKYRHCINSWTALAKAVSY